MGDSGPNLAGLEAIFNDPNAFNVLPYYHNYNEREEYVFTGVFIPAFTCMPKFMDHRGVTDENKAKEYYNAIRLQKSTSPKNWLEYCSEYCFYPEEALSRQGENDFDQSKISEQITRIKVMKETPSSYTRGNLSWNYKDNTDEIIGVTFRPHPEGSIVVVEEPLTDDANRPLDNLYVAGIDSIDQAEGDSVVGSAGSKFAITVKKRIFGNSGDQYVCMYLERPKDVRTAYENAAKILWWYGCKANLEYTKIGFKMWLMERKWQYKMLMKRPMSASETNKRSSNQWGTPGSEKMIRHGLELVANYVDDSCHTIWILPMLEQLQKFSYEAKGRFDIIMSMVYTEIADEDMMGKTVKKDYDPCKEWEEAGELGWFRNEKGYMELGIKEKYNGW